MKRTSKRLLAFVLVLTMAIGIMPFAALSVGAVEPANVGATNDIQFVVNGNLIDAFSTAQQACTMEAPDANVDGMFGWYGVVVNGNTTKVALIKTGEEVTFQRGDVAVLQPLTLDIKQVSDPMLRIKDEETVGMRFLAGVSKAQYQNMLDMIASGTLANATLSFGTSFEAPNGVVKNVPFNMALNAVGKPVWYEETAERGYISGTVWESDIEEMLEGNNIALNTAGIIATAYAKLTFDGKDYYAHAKNDDKKATPIYELAMDALNDLSTQQDADHKLQVGKDLYSPYSISELEFLHSFVDNVVSMKTSDDGETVELIEYAHYNPNSKWEITEVSQGDDDWATLLAQLDNPSNIVLICKLEATDASASAAGGILLDSVLFERPAIEDAGDTYYLIGLGEFTPIN